MKLYTIGFTQKSAKRFFETLAEAQVRRVIDVRLNNVSQLSGFSKREDLAYFLNKIYSIEYIHEPRLAPTQEMLDAYKKNKGNWSEYETRFNALMDGRHVADWIDENLLNQSCLLCSEAEPNFCHRRLVAEIAQQKFPSLQIDHLT